METEDLDFVRGQWLSLNRILDYLNTLDVQVINKKDLYHYIFDLRPHTQEEWLKIVFK